MQKLVSLLNLFKNKYNLFSSLISKVFNKSNLNKAIIIFIIGFISRIIVNNIYGVNVYVEFLNIVSFIYYMFFSLLIVFVHELVTYFDINIIPSFILNSYAFVVKLFNNLFRFIRLTYPYVNIISIKNISLADLKLSSLKNTFNLLFRNRMYMSVSDTDYSKSSVSDKNNVKLPELPMVFNKGDNTYNNYRPNTSNHTNGSNSNNDVGYSPSMYSNNTNGRPNTRYYDTTAQNTQTRYTDLFTLPNVAYNPNLNNNPIPNTNPNSSTNTDPNNIRMSELPPLMNRSYSGMTNESNSDLEMRSPDNNSTSNISSQSVPFAYYPNVISYTPRYGTRPIFSQPNYAVNYRPIMPETPRLENLSTPSTMTPLFSPSNYFTARGLNINTTPSTTRPAESSFSNNIERNRSTEEAYNYRPVTPIQYTRSLSNWGAETIVPNTPDLISSKQAIESPTTSHPALRNQRLSNVQNVQTQDSLENNPMRVPEIQQDMPVYTTKSFHIEKKGMIGKLKLKFHMLESKISSRMDKIEMVCLKYENIGKRKVMWKFFEKDTGRYNSYEDFKRNWDPSRDLWNEIKAFTKTDLKNEILDLIGIRTGPGTIQSEMRRELEDLVNNKRPFAKNHKNTSTIGNSNNKGSHTRSHHHHNRSKHTRHHGTSHKSPNRKH